MHPLTPDWSHALVRLLADGRPHRHAALQRALGIDAAALGQLLRALTETGGGAQVDAEHAALRRPIAPLDEAQIVAALAAAPVRAPQRLAVAGVVTSTNAVLLADAAAWPPVSVLLAEGQRLGRGRTSRRWHSPVGSHVYLSVAFHWPGTLAALSGFTPALGVGLAGALGRCGVPARVKWPNDVLSGDEKLAGILVETAAAATGGYRLVVGVGINVCADDGHDVGQRRTCVEVAAGRPVGRNVVAAEVVAALLATFDGYARDGLSAFLGAWEALDYFRDWPVQVSGGAEPLRGLARGIDAEGCLLLDVGSVRHRLRIGEVSLRGAP